MASLIEGAMTGGGGGGVTTHNLLSSIQGGTTTERYHLVAAQASFVADPAAEDIGYDNAESGLAATDLQGAVDELVGDVAVIGTPPAEDVTYDHTESGLEATDVQAALDEVYAAVATPAADSVTYDNAESGLAATDVQAAVDEVVGQVSALAADGISFDNVASGLAATDVQGALDEVEGRVDTVEGDLSTLDATEVAAVTSGLSAYETLTATEDTVQKALTALSKVGYSLGYGRNLVINGDFAIWQRGTSFTNVAEMTADRWKALGKSTSATDTTTRQEFVPGESPNGSRYYLRCVRSVAASTNNTIYETNLEALFKTAGKKVTFSFWGKASKTLSNIAVRLVQVFGSGGSANVAPSVQYPTFTTSWTKYTLTYTLGSISGKTIGTDPRLGLQFNEYTTQDTFTLELCDVQLEVGEVVTPFETFMPGDQLRRCQRYYQKSYDVGTAPGTAATVGSVHVGVISAARLCYSTIRFSVPMRATPGAVTCYSTVTGASGKARNLSTSADVDLFATELGDQGCQVYGSGLTADHLLNFHWIASAEF